MDACSLAEILWDYHLMHHKIERADGIVVLGSHDTRVAQRGAELYLEGRAPVIAFSGGLGRITGKLWDRPEARAFAEIAVKMGIREEDIIIEERSSNTGENILFTKELLSGRGIYPARLIAVHKPYMERRTYAAFRKLWPEVKVAVTSPQIPFESYCAAGLPEGMGREEVIHIMVGDLQRIRLYPQKGFQIPQKIPPHVQEAFERLVALGYTKHLAQNP